MYFLTGRTALYPHEALANLRNFILKKGSPGTRMFPKALFRLEGQTDRLSMSKVQASPELSQGGRSEWRKEREITNTQFFFPILYFPHELLTRAIRLRGK